MLNPQHAHLPGSCWTGNAKIQTGHHSLLTNKVGQLLFWLYFQKCWISALSLNCIMQDMMYYDVFSRESLQVEAMRLSYVFQKYYYEINLCLPKGMAEDESVDVTM